MSNDPEEGTAPYLAVLLETVVTLANTVVRLPIVRRLFRSMGSEKDSDQP